MSDSLKKKIINVLVIIVALPAFEVVKIIMSHTRGYSSIGELVFIVGVAVGIYACIIGLSILAVNVLITFIMLVQCSKNKQKVTDIYLMPFYYDARIKKLSLKGLLYFSSNYVLYEIDPIETIEEYETLKQTIKKRNNGIVTFVLGWVLVLFVLALYYYNIYLFILGSAMILQLMVQSRFHLRYHCRGISTIVDDAYIIQFISNQLQYQNLKLSSEVIYYLKEQIEAIEIYRFYVDIFRVLLINPNVIDHQDKFIESEMGKLMRENCYNNYRYPANIGSKVGDFYSHFFEHRHLFMLYLIRDKGDYLKRTKDFVERHIEEINNTDSDVKDVYIKMLLEEFTKFEAEYIAYYEGEFAFNSDSSDVSLCSSYRKIMEEKFLSSIIYPGM
ncbi:hypothetical protein [Tannockella kyphosi]|uniref:hypothetical protein n=1 Tax=Tannockella kyphosi TaxID=2899121 RepID=UPI002010E7C8|nr:hypothetical protein [Tannockella kyphosi]